ncbi:acid protease [Dentipellis sp. KUC8613]|nr:acid protease [Dentipellis sp. KUC8613]
MPTHASWQYATEITLGGSNYSVVLDTGSSDLWIGARQTPNLKLTNTTTVSANLSYSAGWASGYIDFAEFSFGSYQVSSQAFLNANKTYDLEALSGYDLDGFIGLSFDQQSLLDGKLLNEWGSETVLGRSVLSNLFSQNPFLPNYITILLGCTGDLEDTSDGIFTVSEIPKDWELIQNTTHIPRYPKDSAFWSLLLDGMHVNGVAWDGWKSSVQGTPAGKAVAVLDSGFTHPRLPQAAVHAIYSQFPGAFLNDGIWFVPCNSSASVTFSFADWEYPVHPLDLTTVAYAPFSDGKNYTYCVNTYQAAEDGEFNGELDLILGQAFLRNTYALFNFGDRDVNGTLVSDPYVQLLALSIADDILDDYAKSRAQALSQLPPLATIDAIKAELANHKSDLPSETSSDYASWPTSASASAGTPSSSGVSKDEKLSNALVDTDGSDAASQVLSKVDTFGPVVVGLLAGNVLIGLVLLVLGVCLCIRRGRTVGASPRGFNSAYVSVSKVDEDGTYRD